jgi:hypothetical protein
VAAHEEEVVLAEELAQTGLLGGAARPCDVEIEQLGSERVRQGHGSHQ